MVFAIAGAVIEGQTRSKPRRNARLTVSATAYCIEGETKSGVQTREGIVAADPTVLPIGTVLRVEGLKGRRNRTYTVADTGRAVKGREIDIFMTNCAAARKFGRQQARVRILKVGSGEIEGADRP